MKESERGDKGKKEEWEKEQNEVYEGKKKRKRER